MGRVAGVLVFLGVAFIPSGLHQLEGFGRRPAYAAAVAAWMAVWWLTEAVPIALTACLPLVAFPLLGVFGKGFGGDVMAAAEPFVDPYIFLFMGGMALGAAMEQTNLHRRVALHIMRVIGTRPKQLLLGILVATAAISMWISNTATAVMMMPIGMALLAQLAVTTGRARLDWFGCSVMLAVAYGANVGGIGTKIGTGTNSIFCGFVADVLKRDIGFLEYVAIGTPFVVLFIPLAWAALWRVGRKDQLPDVQAGEIIDAELRKMGAMTSGERTVATIFLLAAFLWIFADPIRGVVTPLLKSMWPTLKFQGKHYEAVVAMGAGLLCLATRTLDTQGLKRVPWSTLLLLGGSFAMAAGMEGSGLSSWMAAHLKSIVDMPLIAQLALASFSSVFLSAVASNTATINVLINVMPRNLLLLAAATIGSSCDFALPAGTPPNAIVFGSGYVRLPVMMRAGFVLDLVAAAVITLYAYLYLPLLLG
ncbi:MAG: DASS family sodium-coupled anion symporter [Myxococcota bacterium]